MQPKPTPEYPVPVPKLSPSALLSYKNCPKQFEFQKVIGIYGDGSPETVQGSFVHEVLEHLFKRSSDRRTVDDARQVAREVWDSSLDKYTRKTWEQRALAAGVQDMNQFRWNAWNNIETYFQMENPSEIEAVALETWVSGPIINGVHVRGIIDRIVEDADGKLVIQDYKTGKSHDKDSPWDADKRFPMLIYADLAEAERDQEVSKMELLYLSDGVRVEYQPTQEYREELYETVQALYTDIKESCQTGVFVTNKSKLCDWCDHKPYCPAWS